MKSLRKKPELLKGQLLAQAYLKHSQPITEASQKFLYQGSDPDLTMLVLEAVVPGTAEDFIRTQFMEKLGIHNFSLMMGLNGVVAAGSGEQITSRDMLKLGALVLHKGKWNGKQFVPKAFIDRATRAITQPEEGEYSAYSYGYFFWIVPMKVNGHTYVGKLAWGGGSQYIMVFDELNLVIVVTAREREDNMIKLAESRILPAFVKTQDTP